MDRSPAPVRKGRILALVATAQFMLLIDETIVNVALPSIGSDLGLTESGLSWVVNAYFLTFGGFLLLGGRAADLIGRRRMLIAAMLAFGAASLVAGLAESGELLIAGRAAQGLAAALLSPAALSIVLNTFPAGPERTRALGVWAALTGLGAATGLLAGGLITELLDWRWVFFVNVPVGLAAAALVPRLVPADADRGGRTRPDWPGAVLGTGGLLLLVYTVVESESHGWGSARTLGGLAVVAGLAAMFVAREVTAREPLVPASLVGANRVALANVVIAMSSIGLFAMFFFLTLYMQNVQGWGALRTGLSYLPFSLVVLVVSGIVSNATGRLPRRPFLVAGLVTTAAGLWLFRGIEPGDSYLTGLMPIMLVAAAGLGLLFVPLFEAATESAGERDSGMASALATTSQQIGGAVGIAVLVAVATHRTDDQLAGQVAPAVALTDGFSAAFTVAAFILLAAALIATAIGPARPTRTRRESAERDLAAVGCR
jgi:EmrB/QacA subfamily drug resistance transporter